MQKGETLIQYFFIILEILMCHGLSTYSPDLQNQADENGAIVSSRYRSLEVIPLSSSFCRMLLPLHLSSV